MAHITKPLIFILAAAFIARILIFGVVLWDFEKSGLFVDDSWGFYRTAQNLLEGRGFSRDISEPYRPGASFPPLYPLLLAGSLAVSGSVIPLILFQILLSSAVPLLIWKIGQEFTPKKPVWYFASALMALEPLGMILSSAVLTDTLAVFFLTAAVLGGVRLMRDASGKNALGAGLALALAALTRPEPYYIFFIVALFLFIAALVKKLPWRAVFIFSAIFITAISPWIIRNYLQFGSLSIATTGARNIHTSLAVSVETYRSGRPYQEVQAELNRSLAERLGVGTRELYENPALGPALVRDGLRILQENPGATLATFAIILNSFFTQDLYLSYLGYLRLIPAFEINFSPSVLLLKEGPLELIKRIWDMNALIFIPIAGRIFWIALTILWIWGVIRAIKTAGRERLVGLMLASLILIYAGGSLAAGFSDHGRHRYPVNGFIFLLASYGALGMMRPRNWLKI